MKKCMLFKMYRGIYLPFMDGVSSVGALEQPVDFQPYDSVEALRRKRAGRRIDP